MSLTAGTRVGAYEVVSALGAGGMGEVYRARDAKLLREVAIKILPEAFAADPERLARFEREAQILAALNHPNIAQIYGLEYIGPTPALLMELVDGRTLAELANTRGAGSGGVRSGGGTAGGRPAVTAAFTGRSAVHDVLEVWRSPVRSVEDRSGRCSSSRWMAPPHRLRCTPAPATRSWWAAGRGTAVR